MNKSIITSLLLLSISSFLYSQVDMTELDKKYTPISSSKMKPGGGGDGYISNLRNGVSFELLGLTRGQFSFEYQREVFNPSVVALVSVGFPIAHDFVHRFYGTEWASFSSVYNELGYSEFYTNGTTTTTSPWFQTGIRVLFDNPEDLDGRGFEVRFRMQKEKLNFPSSGTYYDFSQLPSDLDIKHRTIFISYRSQASNTPRSRFIHGLSYGLGIRMIDYPSIKLVQENGSFTSNTVAQLGDTPKELILVSVLFTYSVGFGW